MTVPFYTRLPDWRSRQFPVALPGFPVSFPVCSQCKCSNINAVPSVLSLIRAHGNRICRPLFAVPSKQPGTVGTLGTAI